FINTKTIVRGPITKAWFIVNYDNMEYGIASTHDLKYFRCDEQTMALQKSTAYAGRNATGKVIDSADLKGSVPFKETRPGSIGAEMVKYACAPAEGAPAKK
ncbi:MAG: hypothetical protein JNN20_15455, partial [Betaproteobacteria bacterium]|nr:hypothetical protein [Betaproteobacteria bacterium]